ncbi:MAG: mechanosensitive ion channel family protein [Gammaproteobacteria bacterium]|nr:mechanosensitive ion channel family protein [Gammaproteobacteria bacterium]
MSFSRHTLRRLLLILCFAFPLLAQAGDTATEGETASVAPELMSPRATMATFLHAMNDIGRGQPGRIADAVMTLDLSEVSALIRRERGEDLAWMLLDVLDRTREIDLERIPESPKNSVWLFERYRAGSVTIARQADGSWQFSKRTIADLPAISEEVSARKRLVGGGDQRANQPLHLRVRDAMPAYMKATPFLLENWRWLALFVLIVLGVLIDRIVSWFLAAFVRRYRERSDTYREVRDSMLRPLGLMAMAVLWWLGVNLLGLPEQALLVLLVAVKFLAGISAVWTAYRLVDLLTAWMRKRAAATESTLDDALVPLAQRSFKIFVTVIGVVFVADNMNIDISSLLAGLGLGGLAFALAAKDMVQNLFGSITVLLDRTFSVGDWVVTEGVEGTVEEIGFRSTRIRTFYNSVVTVPNSAFITASVDNMGKRRFRRLKSTLGLTYDTPPERIEAFCEALRELVRQHPYMRKDYFQIYFNNFGAASLDVLVYVFWETPDWSTELRERQRFLLDILRVAKEMEVEFAFPTQTLYLREEANWKAPQGSGNREDAALSAGREVGRKIAESQGNTGSGKPPVQF